MFKILQTTSRINLTAVLSNIAEWWTKIVVFKQDQVYICTNTQYGIQFVWLIDQSSGAYDII